MMQPRSLRLLSRLVLAGLVALAAVAFVACSGKDDATAGTTGDSKPVSNAATSGNPPSAGSSDASAGGDSSTLSGAFDGLFRMSSGTGADSRPRPQTSAKPTKDDERYVRQICVAATNLFVALSKLDDKPNASKTPDISSADDFGKAFADMFGALMGPLADFLDGFAKAQPPKDLQDWHAKAAKYMTEAAKSLRNGDFEALNSLDSAKLPDPPDDVMARVDKAAGNVKECSDLDKLSMQTASVFGRN